MLLEYNADTDESTLHDRALTLRQRVAGRKLQELTDQGAITSDTLNELKEANRDVRKGHYEDSIGITVAGVHDRQAFHRADQHLEAEGQVRVLGKDLTRATRLGKAKLDSLNDLERRIIAMRSQLAASIQQPIEVQISNELRTNNKAVKLEKAFKQCIHCSRRILVQLLATHERNCQNVANNALFDNTVTSLEANIVTVSSTFPPQPPRECKVVARGASFIEWSWEPPIVDGGLLVTEYELSYTAYYSEFDIKAGRYKKWEEHVPSYKTTIWAFRSAQIAAKGYKMTHLRAGSEYGLFKIRCYNLRGWSAWVEMVDERVSTNAPDPPTPPLFVACSGLTSSCLHLTWAAPYYDGGLPVVDYIVYYTYIEKTITVTDRDVLVEHHEHFSAGPTAISAVIRNLPSSTQVTNVYICAVNGAHIGAKGMLKGEHVTKDCSRHSKLSRELELASQGSEEYIDSAFFTGVKQRFLRVEHMRRLQAELSITPVDLLEAEEAKEWAAIKEAKRRKIAEEEALLAQQAALEAKGRQDEEDDDAPGGDKFIFTYKQRRSHYQRKIFKLEQTVASLQRERAQIDQSRINQTLSMRAKEQRVIVLNLEHERMKHYHSSVITSNVLNGADMQYQTMDYRFRIERELSVAVSEIAQLKYSIITNENRRLVIKKLITSNEEQYKDRVAKFKEFEINYAKTMRVMGRLNGEEQSERIMLLYFRKLQQYQSERVALRNKIINMFSKVQVRLKGQAFYRWAGKQAAYLKASQSTAEMISIGDIMLKQSYTKRMELQHELRQAMTMTSSLQQKLSLIELSKENQKKLVNSEYFKGMEEGISHPLLYSRGLTMYYEANGYVKENKFALARDLYEGQIISLRCRAIGPQEIKLLALCHGKLGQMFLKLSEANRALIEFDRQLSLAKEVEDKVEESDAFYGLGVGYLAVHDYDNAIRYLTIAQAAYLTLGRYARYQIVLDKLKECYSRMNCPDKVRAIDEKIAERDSIPKRIELLHSQLDNMKSRLAYTAADIELIVPLERMSYRALSLRNDINNKSAELNALEEAHGKQQQVVEGTQALIKAIKDELTKAMDSDALEMYSALVHDQPQVVEIEELKSRLTQRGKAEYEHLLLEQATLSKLAVKIKNIELSISDSDQLLGLENGSLMKATSLAKAFHCVALSATNAAGNEVTGTATGGYEEFAASEGNNIHLLDYHNGELMAIFLGDAGGAEVTGHAGKVTALLHDGKCIFSGGSDERVICWDTMARKLMHVMTGHEGSIVALAAETTLLISSAADVTMRLWNKHTGQQLRVVFGHSKSVLSLELGATWMLTGSADSEVKVWRITPTAKAYSVESTHRLQGHTAPVTCVRYGNVEVLSGDATGNIFIWWLKTGQILRQCKVHAGPVKCMQFDSVHIVSGGVDRCVCVTDIATGEVLQSLRGHTGTVLAMAFDSERILSVGGDNSIRYWQWGKRTSPADKVHVLEENETMVAVAKRYGITIDNLMRWNGILEMKKIHSGMKLIVKKGDPNALTDAERAAVERELRRANARGLVNRKLALLKGHDDLVDDRSRVAKIAMDIDQFSLANRLHGKEARALELFPVKEIPTDAYSLAARMSNEVTDSKQTKVQPPYYITAGNEDEWTESADALGASMLDLFVELMAYEVVLEQKKQLRNKQSVIGRIFLYEKDKAEREERRAKGIEDVLPAIPARKHHPKKRRHADGGEDEVMPPMAMIDHTHGLVDTTIVLPPLVERAPWQEEDLEAQDDYLPRSKHSVHPQHVHLPRIV